jgi:hypothetical protein
MPKINGKRVTPAQADVYNVLEQRGPLPDHALVPLAQHVLRSPQSSSGIRSRRAELASEGLVRRIGSEPTRSGRQAGIFEVV